MGMEQYIRLIAGSFVLISLALGWFWTPYAYLFTAFVGLNLVQSSFTRWCLMENILEATGVAERSGGEASAKAA
jgi:UPF0716 family protein affecting phage T7 exclusion